MQVIKTKKSTEQLFYDSVYVMSHSKKTVKTYKTAINHFKKFLSSRYASSESEIISALNRDQLDVYELLRNFVSYLDELEIKPKGLRGYLSGVKGYLRFQRIKINSDDFKLTVKIPKLIKTREIPLTKEMLLRTLHNSNPKLQTAILVAVSSGLRIGELVQLKLSDIDFNSHPTKISIRGNATKTRQARETFITTEATNALRDYLSRYFEWNQNENNSHLQNKYIFGPTTNKGRKSKEDGFNIESAKLSLQKSLRSHVKNIPELDVTNENGYKAIHFHAFRKFFKTTVSNACGRDYSESLMGHGFYMDTYYQLQEDKKQKMYLDAEPYLTISDFESVDKNFQTLTEKHNELEKTINDLKQYIVTNSVEVPPFLKD